MITQALNIVGQMLKNQQVLAAEKLAGGLSGSCVIKVNASDQSYVVKFLDKKLSSINAQEIQCQHIASENGYGPKVYFSDIDKGIIVMEYLPVEIFVGDCEQRLTLMVQLLKKIHSGPIYPVTMSMSKIFENNLRDICKQGQGIVDVDELKLMTDKLRLMFDNIQKTIACMPLIVPCHRDMNLGNMLYSRGQFFALDYTGSTQDDAYIDLAQVAIFSCFSPAVEKMLLTMYLEREPSDREVAKLALMKAEMLIEYSLFFLEKSPQEFLNQVKYNEKSQYTYQQILQKVDRKEMNFGNPEHQRDLGLAMMRETIDYYHSDTFERDKELLCTLN